MSASQSSKKLEADLLRRYGLEGSDAFLDGDLAHSTSDALAQSAGVAGVMPAPPVEDPIEFAKSCGIDLWGNWDEEGFAPRGQVALARSVVENDMTVCYSCADVGKTFLAALLTCWWLQWPNSIVVATSGTYSQLRAQYWDELQSMYERLLTNPLFEEAPLETQWKMSHGRRVWTRSTKAREFFTGFHKGRVFVIGDEAHGLPSWLPKTVRIAIKTNPRHRILLNGNPVEPVGSYYGLQNDTRWHSIWISQFDYLNFVYGLNPDITPVKTPDGKWHWGKRVRREIPPNPGMDLDINEPVTQVNELGEHDPWIQTYVYGRFPALGSGIGHIFPPSQVDDAFDRKVQPAKEITVGVDVAGSGSDRGATGDRSIVIAALGMKIKKILDIGPEQIARLPVDDYEAYLAYLVEEIDAALHDVQGDGTILAVRVDCDGPGAGVAHNLAARGWPVVEVHTGSLPPRKKPKGVSCREDKYAPSATYVNVRGWMYWHLAHLLQSLDLPKTCRDMLREELLATQPTYKALTITARRTKQERLLGKKKALRTIIEKEQIKDTLQRSPDIADALAMALVPLAAKRRGSRKIRMMW